MARTSDHFVQQFRAARRVSTPIITVRTPDPESSLALTKGTLQNEDKPLVRWDTIRGLIGMNDAGKQEIARLVGEVAPSAVVSPIEVLTQFYRAEPDTILFLSNAHRFWNDPAVVQGIWNVRDVFKAHGAMLVLLVIPGAQLPAELFQDALVLDEPTATPFFWTPCGLRCPRNSTTPEAKIIRDFEPLQRFDPDIISFDRG